VRQAVRPNMPATRLSLLAVHKPVTRPSRVCRSIADYALGSRKTRCAGWWVSEATVERSRSPS
jgi:hypothetical protein